MSNEDATTRPAPRGTPVWVWGLALALLLVASVMWVQAQRYPKRFGVVVPGLLFRSGEVQPHHLQRLQDEYGVITILSLLDPSAPESVAEQQAALKLGITYLNVPLRGNGASKPEDRDRIRQIVLDETNYPMLVHCSAGANRTGLSIGMYRIHGEGWTYDRVLEEMKRYAFEDEAHHENLRAALREEEARAKGGSATSTDPRATPEPSPPAP